MIYCPVCQPECAGMPWIALMCVACQEAREARQAPLPFDPAHPKTAKSIP